MGHLIRHYLNTWSKCSVEVSQTEREEGGGRKHGVAPLTPLSLSWLQCQELQLVTQVECLGFLCQEIGPTIDVTNRSGGEEEGGEKCGAL